jgi:hypothetical protein
VGIKRRERSNRFLCEAKSAKELLEVDHVKRLFGTTMMRPGERVYAVTLVLSVALGCQARIDGRPAATPDAAAPAVPPDAAATPDLPERVLPPGPPPPDAVPDPIPAPDAAARDTAPDVLRPDGPPPPAMAWRKSINVGAGSPEVGDEWHMAADGKGNIVLGWVNWPSGSSCGWSVSNDGGGTWGRAATATRGVGDPAIAVDAAGNIYRICLNYVEKSSDGGRTWTPRGAQVPQTDYPWAAADAGTIWLLAHTAGTDLRISTDDGATWSASRRLSAGWPNCIVYAGGVLYVLAGSAGETAIFSKSTDRGVTWQTKTLAGVKPGSRAQCAVDVARRHFYAVSAGGYAGVRAPTLFHSPDLGDTWLDPVQINDAGGKRNDKASLAVDAAGTVHVGWMDQRNGYWQAWYARSADSGKTFTREVLVSDHPMAARTFNLHYGHGLVVTPAGDVCFGYVAPVAGISMMVSCAPMAAAAAP